MSKFFVGQRVRVILDIDGCGLVPVGSEGRISEIDSEPGSAGYEGTIYGLDIAPIRRNPDRWIEGFASFELAPILDDGDQASDQSFEQLMSDLRRGVIHA